MAAVSQTIPTLLGGVSQQPDPIKLPGQVREADNVLLDPTFGCVKRPPTYLVAEMATNIPKDARWFPIFRDQSERYVAVTYRESGTTHIRCFEGDSGIERTVNILGDSQRYLDVAPENLEFLTINDYTLVCNTKMRVSMSRAASNTLKQEALVVVNQVGYNTTYTIDFLKDGQGLVQEKVYRAQEIEVSPGSFEIEDGDGACPLVGSQDFLEDNGSRKNLGFNLQVNCNPVQVTEIEKGATFPTGVELRTNSSAYAVNRFFYSETGGTIPVEGSYVYVDVSIPTKAGNINLRCEGRVSLFEGPTSTDRYVSMSSVTVTSYTSNGDRPWSTFNFLYGGIAWRVSGIDRGPDIPQYSYKSSYSASVTLQNGGEGWTVGSGVTVSLNGRDYRIKVTRTSIGYNFASEDQVDYTTSADATSGPLDVGEITGALVAQIKALDNYDATPIGNVIYIERTDSGKVFNIAARGGSTNKAMYALKGNVNDISQLPGQGVNGVLFKVSNSQDSEADDYYVKFETAEGDIPGQGSWVETVKPGISTEFNGSTMPHVLIRQSDGTFQFRELSADYDEVNSYAAREVGDEDTNPQPTFVGKAISGMTFHMNRLGFLSGDTIVMSQPGDYFNFFVGSAIAISDADPIDMAATSTRPANLKSAVSTPKGLLIFSTDAQFRMSAQDVAFGPQTVKVDEISNYSNVTGVRPMEVGTSIFFNSDSTTFSKVFEMSIDSVDNRPQVAENTRTIPEYIPSGLKWGASSANNSIVMYGDNTGDVYVFKYWNQGNERSLAGWTRWRFASDIHLTSFYDDVAYIVSYNNTRQSWVLSKMNLLDDPITATISMDDRRFEPRLDNYVSDAAVTEVIEGDYTKFYLQPGQYAGQETAVLQFNEASSSFYLTPPIESDGGGEFIKILTRNLRNADAYNLGMVYTMLVELPQIYMKKDKNVDRVFPPMVTNVNLELYLSGNYTVGLQRLGYEDNIQLVEAKVSDVYILGSSSLINTATKQVGVYCRGDMSNIYLTSVDPMPAGITGYTWEGHYNNRGISRIT
uniref:DNA polymerase n=1 Tax=uncultured marine virus TaxID=186617 RepID=A0A0F7LB49_9VIRU|nr:DNA polymerase [uncultured marine virus]